MVCFASHRSFLPLSAAWLCSRTTRRMLSSVRLIFTLRRDTAKSMSTSDCSAHRHFKLIYLNQQIYAITSKKI
jgi:hypothetical protein